MRRTRARGAKRLAILVVVAACSSNESNVSTGTPASDAGVTDAAARPGDANDWTCLGKVVLPAHDTPVSMDFSIASAVNGTPTAGAAVRACPGREDATCANAVGPLTTDADGHAMFEVPAGFDGYWEAVEPDGYTALHFMPFRVWRSPDIHARVQWHFDELKLLTDTIGLAFDTTKGHVLMQATDCDFSGMPGNPVAATSPPYARAGGVTFALEPMPPGVNAAYVEIEPHARVRTDLDETADGYGGGAFMNVPPGIYTVSAKRKSTGERIGSQRIHVRADTFSLLVVVPSP
jgi:hypothetical protein